MKWLQLVLQFFPTVLQVIMTIETAVKSMPASSAVALDGTAVTPVVISGAQKKALAMAILQPADADAAGVGKLVDVSVGALNTTGIFDKK